MAENRVEFVFGARVDRPQIDAAAKEAQARAAAASKSTAGGKPVNVAIAEDAAKRTKAREQEAEAQKKAAEATKVFNDAQDRSYQVLSRVQDKIGQVSRSFSGLNAARFGDAIQGQSQRAERELQKLAKESNILRNALESPITPQILAKIDPLLAKTEEKMARLERRLQRLQAAGAAKQTEDLADIGGGSDGGPGSPGGPDDPGTPRNGPRGDRRAYARRRAVAILGQGLGISERVTQLGELSATGGGAGFLAAGGGAVALAGVVKLIQLNNAAEKSQRDLQVAALDTGQSFGQMAGYTDSFRASIIGTTQDAQKLAAALGDLQLRTGGKINAGATAAALGTIATARDLSSEEAAKQIAGLGRGDKGAFEALTGRSADVALDRYARSIGTTASRLTEMQRAQVLTNAAVAESARFAEIADRRVNSFGGRWERAKAAVGDFLSEYGQAFVNGVLLNESAEETYKRKLKEVGADQSQASIDQQNKANAARAEELRILEDQAKVKQKYDDAFSKRGQRDLAAGRFQPGDQLRGLLDLRSEFEAERGKLSTDDAEATAGQFFSAIGGFADQATSKVQALQKSIRESTAEFAAARLPTDQANPYVKIFSEAEEAGRRLQERFGLLGDVAVAEIGRAQKAMRDAATFELAIKDNMSAVKLEFEAAQLAKPFVDLTTEMKRSLTVFKSEFSAATLNPQDRADAAALRSGRYPTDIQQRRQREDFYTDIFGMLSGGALGPLPGNALDPALLGTNGAAFGPVAQNGSLQIARRLAGARSPSQMSALDIEKFNIVSEYLLSGPLKDVTAADRYASDPFRRGLVDDKATILEARAGVREREVQRSLARAEVDRGAEQLAGGQLRELQRLGGRGDANADRTRQEFLAITGALPREALSPELAKGRIQALRDEAVFQRQREQKAAEAVQKTLEFQAQLIGKDGKGGILGSMLQAVQSRQDSVIVEVLDKTDSSKVSTLGQGFGAGPAASQPAATLPDLSSGFGSLFGG